MKLQATNGSLFTRAKKGSRKLHDLPLDQGSHTQGYGRHLFELSGYAKWHGTAWSYMARESRSGTTSTLKGKRCGLFLLARLCHITRKHKAHAHQGLGADKQSSSLQCILGKKGLKEDSTQAFLGRVCSFVPNSCS